VEQVIVTTPVQPAPVPATAPLPPAGRHPDSSGRFEHRYWDDRA
jgi:hypothetical protein